MGVSGFSELVRRDNHCFECFRAAGVEIGEQRVDDLIDGRENGLGQGFFPCSCEPMSGVTSRVYPSAASAGACVVFAAFLAGLVL